MLTTSLYASLILALGASAQSVADKIAALRLAPTSTDRIMLLNDSEFVFDFLHPASGRTTGAAGHTVEASSANFPAVVGNGMAMTIGFLGPCGINTPHTHPRATEFNFVVNGTLQAGLLVENGARFVLNELSPGQAAIFPRGAIHFEFNNGCEDALFVAAFNNEDPGVQQVAQRFFGLPPDIVNIALGDIGVEQVAGLEAKASALAPHHLIPDNIAFGADECLQRCGIKRTDQPTSQRQPRVSGNALPSGFNGPPAVSSSPATATISLPSLSPVPVATGSGAIANVQGDASIASSDGKPDALSLGLLVAVCVLAAGYLIIAAVWFVRCRRERNARTKGGVYFRTGADFAPRGLEKPQRFESYGGSYRRGTPYDAPEGGAP
ncbi:uncharacterized protein PHACADRAFT_206707 [Phanerochaete carnosa HHB-10118-sp]|uniref:Cupin type-1 domain-containing protein n=1 Tax=Phanerochaete carnosa (strain HHB-10118-sp) TaxID=650164 RepID=K5WF01_PHACS|nr:uncharacterized protein PHACADRAFT_206707 [Phanerochaete carnosa HHB-10118-sp]EKM57835.1 hypothetical protein PHACADRAFT_206707 [Phanerochaete carnosa HHB-10118-sp]